MSLGDKIRELDEQVAEAVRRAVEDLRGEMRHRLDEATLDLQRRLSEVAPELPRSFVDEEHLRRIAEEAAAPSQEALEAARDEGRALGREDARSGARDEARREAHQGLRAALSDIDRGRGQADVLQRLLDASAPYARRAAVLLLRDGRLSGWGARGFEADAEAARAASLPAEEPPWSVVAGGGAAAAVPGPRCATLVSQLDSALPREGVVVPLILRDRVAALLYADRPEASDPLDVEALQVLTYAAALALETLALREREATATLLPADLGEVVAVPAPEAAAEGEEEPEAEPEEYELTEEPSFEGGFDLEVEEVEAEPAVEVEPADFGEATPTEVSEVEAPEVQEPEVEELEVEEPVGEAPEGEVAGEEPGLEPAAGEGYGTYPEESPVAGTEPEDRFGFETPEAPATPPHGDELLPRRDDYLEAVEDADARAPAGTEEVDETALEETAFDEAPELEEPETSAGDAEPAIEEGTTEEPSAPIPWRTETQDTTAVTPPPSGEGALEEEPAAETAAMDEDLEERPEAGEVPPPPKPGGAGGAVEPPADVEGPGWAFSAAREPVAEHEEAAHEEARRLARLLVSEIQLYNQDEVDEGRRNRDVYDRLKDDIERSRQLYEERVDPGVRETTDYFYQELVRQLAAGDAKALGI